MAESVELQMSSLNLRGATRLTTQEHFTKLYCFLRKHADKWEEIGLCLGFLPPELNSQKSLHGNDVLRLSEMLSQWLQWAPGDGRGSKSFSTLEQLQSALKNNSLGVSAFELKKAMGINISSSLVPMKPGEQTLDFPYLDLKGQTEAESEAIELQLGSDTTEIMTAFSSLIEDTKQSLKDQGKSPKDVASCVVSMAAYRSHKVRKPISEDQREKLEGAESIDDIFLILPYHISFFNYELLAYIISKLGSDNDKGNLKQYLEKFELFCKRKVFEVPPHVYGQTSQAPSGKSFVVKLTDFDQPILEDVSIAKKKIAFILGVRIAMLQLLAIEKGCIELHFMLPEYIYDEVFPLEISQLEELSSEGMIIWLSNTNSHRTSLNASHCSSPPHGPDTWETSLMNIRRHKERFLLSETVQLPFQTFGLFGLNHGDLKFTTTLSEGTYRSVKLKGTCSAEFEWEVASGAIDEYGITINYGGHRHRVVLYKRFNDTVRVDWYESGTSPTYPNTPVVSGLSDLRTLIPGNKVGLQVTANGKLRFFLNGKCEETTGVELKEYLSGSVHPFVRIRGGDVRVTRAVMARYLVVPSLQEVCMEVIGKSVELEDAENLPLPHHVKEDLKSYIIHRIMDPAPQQYLDLF